MPNQCSAPVRNLSLAVGILGGDTHVYLRVINDLQFELQTLASEE